MIYDPIRIAAAAAGIAILVVLAAPLAASFARDLRRTYEDMRGARDASIPPFDPPPLKPLPEPLRNLGDMRFVLELAARLQAVGKVQAVKLCQQLIDEMLSPQPAAKGKKE